MRAPVGRHDLLIVRTDDGGIAGLHNRCAHRGAQIVAHDAGDIQTFNCSYHGWTYARDGSLFAIPAKGDYGADFDTRQHHLHRVANIASHRGFIFARANGGGPHLETFLAPIVDSINNMIDRSPTGELVYGGNHFRRYFTATGNCRWRTASTPRMRSSFTIHRRRSPRSGNAITTISTRTPNRSSNDLTPRQWNEIEVHWLRNGHGHLGGFYREGKLAPEPDDPVFRDYKQTLVARHGPDKTQEILVIDRFNSIIYLNLTINIRFQVVRYAQPISVNKNIVHAVFSR